MQDKEKLTHSIQEAKWKSDFIVVNMHAWQEYTRKITPLQHDFARAAIDAGADIVLGGHPHWVQEIEHYRGKYIFYSLWNFVFDQEFSTETKTWLAVQIFLEKDNQKTLLEKILLHPIFIENYGQPRLMSGEEKIKVLKDINQQTDELK
jgi:poly-gamma-glutamate synthesis protein (capsule biosynthesis protein)